MSDSTLVVKTDTGQIITKEILTFYFCQINKQQWNGGAPYILY